MRERKKEGEEAEIGTTFTSGSLRKIKMHVRDDEDRLKEKYIPRRKNERER